MDYNFQDNALTAEAFNALRESAGWRNISSRQAEEGLSRSLYTVSVMDEKRTIGMGRLVGDGAIIWYVQDVVVLPQYQGKGIGSAIMQRLISFAQSNSLDGTDITLGLMAAKGKEGFYQKLGFRVRPNDKEDAGMIMNVKISHDNISL